MNDVSKIEKAILVLCAAYIFGRIAVSIIFNI